jgi:hypothetical protein
MAIPILFMGKKIRTARNEKNGGCENEAYACRTPPTTQLLSFQQQI